MAILRGKKRKRSPHDGTRRAQRCSIILSRSRCVFPRSADRVDRLPSIPPRGDRRPARVALSGAAVTPTTRASAVRPPAPGSRPMVAVPGSASAWSWLRQASCRPGNRWNWNRRLVRNSDRRPGMSSVRMAGRKGARIGANGGGRGDGREAEFALKNWRKPSQERTCSGSGDWPGWSPGFSRLEDPPEGGTPTRCLSVRAPGGNHFLVERALCDRLIGDVPISPARPPLPNGGQSVTIGRFAVPEPACGRTMTGVVRPVRDLRSR